MAESHAKSFYNYISQLAKSKDTCWLAHWEESEKQILNLTEQPQEQKQRIWRTRMYHTPGETTYTACKSLPNERLQKANNFGFQSLFMNGNLEIPWNTLHSVKEMMRKTPTWKTPFLVLSINAFGNSLPLAVCFYQVTLPSQGHGWSMAPAPFRRLKALAAVETIDHPWPAMTDRQLPWPRW